MTQKLQTILTRYYDKVKVLKGFSVAESLLSWDRETHMPIDASAERGQAMAVLAGFTHQLFTDSEFVKDVDVLFEAREELSPIDRRAMVVTKRALDKSVKLPKAFVEESNELVNAAHTAWLSAKEASNFPLFEPHLAKVVENRKQYAQYINPDENAYDLLLDEYEEGLTSKDVDVLFSELKAGLKELLPKVLEKQAKEGAANNPLNGIPLDKAKLQTFLHFMLETIGFDFKKGALGEVEHPFEISISNNDVRLNTHYEKSDHSFTVMGMVHELGHGLYEQNIASEYHPTFLSNGVSLGIHESQSRLLENIIGRTSAFWTFFFPQLQTYFPELKSAKMEDLLRALNCVQPSLIRTEADEVTYNLHIAVRFELEKQLIHGKLATKNLPEAWSAQMKELLGIQPTSDTDGVLQDVHWSWGNLGYFPTYSLGNLNSAQLWVKFTESHPHWENEISEGNFTSYFTWFKEKIWQHGSFYTPEELMMHATGEKTNAKYFLEYLKKKYL
jgi:carboxypeptidase Taq